MGMCFGMRACVYAYGCMRMSRNEIIDEFAEVHE